MAEKSNGLERAKLEAEHGEIATCSLRGQMLAFRGPTQAEFDCLTDKLAEDKGSKASAMRQFVLGCCVHPAREDAKALLAKAPAACGSIALTLQKMGGADVQIDVGKSET